LVNLGDEQVGRSFRVARHRSRGEQRPGHGHEGGIVDHLGTTELDHVRRDHTPEIGPNVRSPVNIALLSSIGLFRHSWISLASAHCSIWRHPPRHDREVKFTSGPDLVQKLRPLIVRTA
jgi:hypothetical protein